MPEYTVPTPASSLEFVASLNRKVVDALNPLTGKIAAGGNFAAFNQNWTAETLTAEEIYEAVGQKFGLCAWHLQNGERKRNGTGCIQAGLIIIDIDNQADGKDEDGNKIQKQELTIEEALKLPVCEKYLTVAYKSPTHTEEWPRFRLVFGLETPITDPDFYQWFTKKIAEAIPGHDRRAQQVPNLFYGAKDDTGKICVTDKFIPALEIAQHYRFWLANFEQLKVQGLADETTLELDVDDDGVNLVDLLNWSSRNVFDGEEVEDRSSAMAALLKELIGWSNWLREAGIKPNESPLTAARRAFYNIYEYESALDGKFDRILNSIQDPDSCRPAITLAADTGELAAWLKIRKQNKELFEQKCPAQLKEQLKEKQQRQVNSVLDFSALTEVAVKEPTSQKQEKEPEPEMTHPTPNTPTQLVSLQKNKKEFSENDVADIIYKNFQEVFLFDSLLDEFFIYDDDEDIWYLQDEQHIKRRIINALDTFVHSGVLPRYGSGTVTSVFHILKGKFLRSLRGGRDSIWDAGKGFIPFKNGVYETKTGKFLAGAHKELYFRTKLQFDFDASKLCPNFVQWINAAIGPDKAIVVQAFCRAVLTGYTTSERFLHLVGPGGTGKSTLQQVLIALAGFHGTHTTSLELLETSRFEAYNLIGKRLALLTDEANYSKRMDTLKKITSASDTLRAERKYGKETINFKPQCLVCMASNEHIASSDTSSGLERRRLTLVMDKVVPASQRRDLINVYEDHIEGVFVDELPGIVNWALSLSFETMRDVLANPIKHAPSMNLTNFDALIYNNPIVAWLAECTLYSPGSACVIGSGAYRPSTDESERGLFVKNAYTELYASYVNFCKANGYKNAAKPRFVDRLKETINNVLNVRNCEPKLINGKFMYVGLRLKPYDPSTDRAASGDNRLPSIVEFASDPANPSWQAAFTVHDKTDSDLK